MSWKPEVLVENKWAGNALVFATEQEAFLYGRDLLARWIVPVGHRAVESDEPVNYRRLEDGSIKTVDEARLREDWKYEVTNGDTGLGFSEWLEHQAEAENAR